MKKILSAATVLIIILSSCTKSITGSGIVVTENRQVAAFTRVRLEGDAQVQIIQGNTQKITVSGYDNLVPIFETYVSNGLVTLRFETGYYNIHRNNINVLIEMPDLPEVRSSGSGDITILNFLNSPLLNAGINGSGNIIIEGSSFDKVVLSVNGSGNIKAVNAQIKEAEADVNGSGDIELSCSQKLTAHISGSGNINYYGNPAIADIRVSGSGKVRKR